MVYEVEAVEVESLEIVVVSSLVVKGEQTSLPRSWPSLTYAG